MDKCYGLAPTNFEGVRNVEVTPAQGAYFSVVFDDLIAARKAATAATEYGDYIEGNLRGEFACMLDGLINKVNSIFDAFAAQSVDKSQIKSAVELSLSDEQKAAINRAYSSQVGSLMNEIRNAVIDCANTLSGDEADEEEYKRIRQEMANGDKFINISATRRFVDESFAKKRRSD